MKKAGFIFILILFAQMAMAQSSDSAELAQNVVNAIKSGKIEEVKKLIAPPSVYREMYAETKQMSNEEIKQKTSESEKLSGDFDNLLQRAKTKKVKLAALQYDSLTAENAWNNYLGPWALVVYFSVDGKQTKLAVSALRHKGQWYFMEFLMTTNAFKEF